MSQATLNHIRNAAHHLIDAARLDNEDNMRKATDAFRNSRSGLARERSDLIKYLGNWGASDEILQELQTISIAENISAEFIELSAARLKLGSNQEDVQIKRLVDLMLPEVWSFEHNVAVVTGLHAEMLIDDLIKRGQQNIIVDAEIYKSTEANNILTYSIKNPQFDELTQRKAWNFGEAHHFFLGEEIDTDKTFFDQVKKSIDLVKMHNGTIRKFSKTWVINQLNNLEKMLHGRLATDVMEKIKGQDVLVVSPGPSLAQSIAALKKVQHKAIILAMAQAVPALVKNNITIDYAFIVDPADFSDFIEPILGLEDIGIIVHESCHINICANNPEQLIVMATDKDQLDLPSIMGGYQVTPTGSSVSGCAVDFCIKSAAKSIGLVGQDLVIGETAYYGISPKYNETRIIDDHSIFWNGSIYPIQKLRGINGEWLVSRPDFVSFHHEFELLAENCPDGINLYNFTAHGAQIDGFENAKLNDVYASNAVKANVALLPVAFEEIAQRTTRAGEKLREIQQNIDGAKTIVNELISALSGGVEEIDFTIIDQLENRLREICKTTRLLDLMLQTELVNFDIKLLGVQTLADSVLVSLDLHMSVKEALEELEQQICKSIRSLLN
jgi:hypothetical protein